MSNIKWLLVGAGDIAFKRVADAIQSAEGSELTAICDTRLEQAQKLADERKVSAVYDNYELALEQSGCDAVYVATPVQYHVPQGVAALKAGKHTLIEKPLGLNVDECEPLASLAEKSGLTAGCAYFRRLFPRYEYTKKMLKNGEFGKVVSARMTYFSWFNPAKDDPKYWRVLLRSSGGGPLSDMGTHMFDVMIGLFGMPRSVYAKLSNIEHHWETEDTASVIMELANGAHVTGTFQWNSKTWRHEFEIVGTEAKIDWLPYDAGDVIKTVGRNTESISLPSADNVHAPLVQDFVNAIKNKTKPVCPISEAIKTTRLIDAIHQSSDLGKEIRLD